MFARELPRPSAKSSTSARSGEAESVRVGEFFEELKAKVGN